ncbi:MAG: hypothetical protein HQL37_12320, partial [Alphaproteobacteria bacterium]|nr:hypothetical protein [Alphaproteobacteria bacterium]
WFKSDFTISRLPALAMIDPFKGDTFYENNKDDIVPEKRRGIVTLLGRALTDLMGKEFAAGIVGGRPPEGLDPIPPFHFDPAFHLPAWLVQADHVAAGNPDNHPRLGLALRSEIIGHVAARRREIGCKARRNRNRLLAAILGDRVTTPDWRVPALALAWAGAPPGLIARLRQLMVTNCSSVDTPLSRNGQGWSDEAYGLRIAAPESFRRLDLSHSAYDVVPPLHRLHLLRLQDAHDQGLADGTVSRDLCRRMERIHPHLPAYAKE